MNINRKGLQLLQQKDFIDAEKMFTRAIGINSGNKFYYNNLAVAQMKQGKYDNAYNNLLKAVAIDPGYVKAYSNLAVTCFHLRKYPLAYRHYVRARALDREYVKKRFAQKNATGVETIAHGKS